MALTMFSVAILLVIASLCITGGRAVCPMASTGVMAVPVGADGIYVTWKLPPDIHCQMGYRVFLTTEREGKTVSAGVGSNVILEYTVPSLLCNTAYIVAVASVGQNGMTEASLSEEVRVLVGGPRNFSASAVSSTSVHLTWEPPASSCNESITGYEVTYTCSECGMPGEGRSPPLTGVEYTFDHLEEDTEYQFRLRAAGEDFTDPVSVRTPTASTEVVTGNTDTSSESLGTSELTVTLLVTARKTGSRTSRGHVTGEQLPTPTNGSPTSASGASSPVGVAVGVAVVVVLLVVIIIVAIAILILWMKSISKMKQQHNSSPGMAMMECPAYGEVKPQPDGPPPEAIYEQPQ